MQYRKLGRTGLKVSVISIGTYQLGGIWGEVFSREEGINLIDTAECNSRRLAERLTGQAIKSKSDRWIVTTAQCSTLSTSCTEHISP